MHVTLQFMLPPVLQQPPMLQHHSKHLGSLTGLELASTVVPCSLPASYRVSY